MQRNFPGTKPTPFEIPKEVLGEEKQTKSKRPIMVSIIAVYLAIRGVVYIFCSSALFGDTTTGFATFLFEHSRFVFTQLPLPFMPFRAAAAYSEDAYRQLLPSVFAIVAVYSFIASGLVWMLNYWVRWIVMFVSGATAIKTIINLMAASLPVEGPSPIPVASLTTAEQAGTAIGILINLTIFFYLAFYPGVKEAFAPDEI